MNQEKAYYRAIAVGIAIGVLTTSFFFVHKIVQPRECEAVVDVEYKRTGKKTFVSQTVVRQPVRDGKRCLLAEVGS